MCREIGSGAVTKRALLIVTSGLLASSSRRTVPAPTGTALSANNPTENRDTYGVRVVIIRAYVRCTLLASAETPGRSRRVAPTPNTHLNRERIVSAAMEIADADGVDALSMRTLAARLGAGTMSLYNHVDSKDDLLDQMTERVAAEISPPAERTHWKDGIRSLVISTRIALQQHPWAVDSWSARLPGPRRWTLMEQMLALLASAGLSDEVADLAFHALLNHVLGYTRQEHAFADSDSRAPAAGVAASLDAQRFPHVREHLRYHAQQRADHDSFLFVLDLILDGLDDRPHDALKR